MFATGGAFQVPYKPNLDVINDGGPFFLGTADTSANRTGVAAIRRVIRETDLPRLAASCEAAAGAIVNQANGRLELVDQLVRRVIFDVLAPYFGVPPPLQGRLDVWATRLFEFQFASSLKDQDLRWEVDGIAPAFGAHR